MNLHIDGSGNTEEDEDSGHGNPPPKDPPKTGGRSVPQEPTDTSK